MNELALFAGAGGGMLGGKLLGWRTVCAVELDAHCACLLAQRQDDGCFQPFPIWSDVRSFDGRRWRGIVDVISGGFPCQDISPAGKGAGIKGERSGLWREFVRVLREVRPLYAFVENSAALASRGLDVVLADMAALGFDAEWDVFSARESGFPHVRERLWIVAADTERRERWAEPHDGPDRRMGRIVKPFAWDAHWLDVFTGVRGNGDGMADRLDRTDAVRNGQVPRVAARAWHELHERLLG